MLLSGTLRNEHVLARSGGPIVFCKLLSRREKFSPSRPFPTKRCDAKRDEMSASKDEWRCSRQVTGRTDAGVCRSIYSLEVRGELVQSFNNKAGLGRGPVYLWPFFSFKKCQKEVLRNNDVIFLNSVPTQQSSIFFAR